MTDKRDQRQHSKDDEQAFLDWLNQGDEAQETALADETWQSRQATANFVSQVSKHSQDASVPNWHREATFDNGIRQQSNTWWSQWLPISSMAFSCFALALVLFNVQLTTTEQGLTLAFGNANVANNGASGVENTADAERLNEQQLAQLSDVLDRRLQEFANQQKLILADHTNDLQAQQQSSNLQLASYILSTSRQERKEDFGDFIKFVNQQRKDDQLSQEIQFKQLEQTLLWQQTANTSSYQDKWQSQE
ncbi:hypothetical protein J7384_07800 [Endozoicomonas sp. G2_1]|uniref:hypothetical protein n=1 Tax=Endozoicomonas sp. G2_1 TaxID=2821091 RepID=UPI001ADC367F|nr:hypothetical protein [Endozoicomonas sp. G2_1]MBO9490261.1 hypothetical protein [Endozoicomonas sp. G2_1]